MKRSSTFIFIFLLLVLASYGLAYAQANIESYYNFEDGANHSLTDSVGGFHLNHFGNNATNSTGIQGRALNFSQYAPETYFANKSYNLTSASWSINFWTFNYGLTNTQRYINFGVNGSLFYLLPKTTGTFVYNSSGGLVIASSYVISSKAWHMFTLVYDTTDLYLYVDTDFLGSNSTYNGRLEFLKLGANPYNIMDELAVFSETLDAYERQLLYDSGTGLDFTETFLGAGSELQAYTYYDICVNTQPYAYVCKEYNVIDGEFSCDYLDREYCFLSCADEASYWEAIEQSPPDLNYSGHCSACATTFGCDNTTTNATRCNGDYSVATCQYEALTGCYGWFVTSNCLSNEVCDDGVCIDVLSNDTAPIGSVSTSSVTDWNNFLGISSSTAQDRLLIAVVAIILVGLSLSALAMAIAWASGSNVPVPLSATIVAGGTLLTFIYFSMIGFIPLWTLVLIVVFCAFIFAVFSRKMIMGGG